MNTKTAAERGIRNGDIVKVHNERGIVLGGAYVSERIMPGVVSMDHGSRCDWISAGEIDRGGAINLISPTNTVSKNCNGMASSGYLVEVEKVSEQQVRDLLGLRDRVPVLACSLRNPEQTTAVMHALRELIP